MRSPSICWVDRILLGTQELIGPEGSELARSGSSSGTMGNFPESTDA